MHVMDSNRGFEGEEGGAASIPNDLPTTKFTSLHGSSRCNDM
ncbi:hypothetical protein HJC23_003861 [Cyclotella cryptica]|uniref:Uncharacterized protein n=1 Tax=Cyclotella cryptica TaxID=29204 RepID=A0ABD3Q175_9STRA